MKQIRIVCCVLTGLAGCAGAGQSDPFAAQRTGGMATALQPADERPRMAPLEAGASGNAAAGSPAGGLRAVTDLPPPSNSRGGTLQFISADDVLEIKVFGIASLDRTAQVDSTGRISLPLIGLVEAAGKTAHQLETEIERRYGVSHLQSPEVTIVIKESAGQRVTVDGEVRRSGIYPIAGRATLLRVLALAQGLNAVGNPSKIYVYREVDGVKYVANYDAVAIRKGRKTDPPIHGGDVVVVFASQTKVAMENLRSVLGLATSAGGLRAVVP